MDPVIIAGEAISLLVPHFTRKIRDAAVKIGKDVGDLASGKIEKLYETIKEKFKGDDFANQSLKRLEEKPEDDDRQTTMKSALKDILAEDPQFQKSLIQLLAEVRQAHSDKILQTGSGSVAINRSVAAGQGGYAAAGDMYIGIPPKNKE